MKALAGQPDIKELSAALDRIAELRAEIEQVPADKREYPNQRLARAYNTLRDAIVQMTADDFRRSLAPGRVLSANNWQIAAFAAGIILLIAVLTWLTMALFVQMGFLVTPAAQVVCFIVLFPMVLFGVAKMSLDAGIVGDEVLFASTKDISERTGELQEWLQNFVAAERAHLATVAPDSTAPDDRPDTGQRALEAADPRHRPGLRPEDVALRGR